MGHPQSSRQHQISRESGVRKISSFLLILALGFGSGLPMSAQHRGKNDQFYRGAQRGVRGGNYGNDRGRHYNDHYNQNQGGIGPGKGALIGGGVGAAAGALFGGGVKGALITGAAGAGVGAILGGVAQSNRDNNNNYYHHR
jgi:hypothetical protein